LKNIHRTLPEELKMDFEKNRDLEDIDRALGEARAAPPAALPRTPSPARVSASSARSTGASPWAKTSRRSWNACWTRPFDVTGAERGVLPLKKEGRTEESSPTFEVRVSRHMSRGALEGDALKLSFTAVLEAVQKGEAVLTDDAQLDPRFRKKQSVVAHGLKIDPGRAPWSTRAIPIGAVYLDHRYRPGCFSEESILFLTALSAQASLVIQKARLIAELETAKKSLEGRVDEQSRKSRSLRGTHRKSGSSSGTVTKKWSAARRDPEGLRSSSITSRRRRSPSGSWENPAPARSWWPARSTSTAAGRTVRSSRKT
jgi:hypothetical protein